VTPGDICPACGAGIFASASYPARDPHSAGPKLAGLRNAIVGQAFQPVAAGRLRQVRKGGLRLRCNALVPTQTWHSVRVRLLDVPRWQAVQCTTTAAPPFTRALILYTITLRSQELRLSVWGRESLHPERNCSAPTRQHWAMNDEKHIECCCRL